MLPKYKPFIPHKMKVEENIETLVPPLTPGSPILGELPQGEVIQTPEEVPVQEPSYKVLFIHGASENEEETLEVAEALKEKFSNCEIKDIHLYELNIQPEEAIKDGMSQIYQALEQSDVIVLTMDADKSDSLQAVLKRIINKYVENKGLQYKSFCSIVMGGDIDTKDELLSLAYCLGMIVMPQSIIIDSNSLPDDMTLPSTILSNLKNNIVTTDNDTEEDIIDSNTGEQVVDTTTDESDPNETLEEGEDENTDDSNKDDDTDESDTDDDSNDTEEENEETVFSYEEWKKRQPSESIIEAKKILDINDFIALYEKKYTQPFNDAEIL
jgi:hypothetical protein